MDPQMLEVAVGFVAGVTTHTLDNVLGPWSKRIGKQWDERLRDHNLKRLLLKSERRMIADGRGGFASPRVAAKAFETVQYADDEMVAEYLSGVLASVRSPDGRNDAGIAWASLIARLSSDQLRLHYIIYSSSRACLIDSKPEHAKRLHNIEVLLPLDAVTERFMPDTEPPADWKTRFEDAADGLMREGLIGDNYRFGQLDGLLTDARRGTFRLVAPFENGFTFKTSIHGIRLYLWGLGHGEGTIDQYIDRAVELRTAEDQPSLTPIDSGGIYERFWEPRTPPAD